MGFFLTMFMGGPLLGYLLLSLAGVDGWAMRLLPAISVLALVVSGVVSVMQAQSWRLFIVLCSRPQRWCRTMVR